MLPSHLVGVSVTTRSKGKERQDPNTDSVDFNKTRGNPKYKRVKREGENKAKEHHTTTLQRQQITKTPENTGLFIYRKTNKRAW